MAKKATRKPDNSPYIYQQKKVSSVDFKITDRIPFTEKQMEFIQLAQNKDVKAIFVNGPPGCGKTLLSVYCGLLSLREKKTSDILYIREILESSSNRVGWLPGTLEQKISPFADILWSKVDELVSPETKNALINNQLITPMSTGFLRGHHFSVRFIIADECQQMGADILTTLLTRIGEKSKILLCGDPMQRDLPVGKSGFVKFMNAFDTEEARSHGIHVFKFGKEDIMRSELVKYIVGVIEEM